jgi:hypothetical protein
MARDVVAVIDDWPASRGAVADAIDIAQAEHARLTLVARYAEPSPWLSLAGLGGMWVDRDALRRDAQEEALAALDAALAIVPAELPVDTHVASRHRCSALARSAAIVVDSSRRRRLVTEVQPRPWPRYSLRGNELSTI